MECLRTYASCFFRIYLVSTNPCPQATDCSGCMQADPRCGWCLDDVSSRPVLLVYLSEKLVTLSWLHESSRIISTPLLKFLFHKVAELKVCNFIEKRFPRRASAEPYLGLIQTSMMQRFCENRQRPWHMELRIQKQSYEGIFKRGVLKNFAKWKHLCHCFSLT